MTSFSKFQQIWQNLMEPELMGRAKHFYSQANWIRVLDHYDLGSTEVANACNVAPATIDNAIAGRTKAVRRGTRKKMEEGFLALGVSEEDIKSLFITQ